MAVENFIWDSESQSVSWTYNGKEVKEKFENAHFASLNTQKNFIYVEAGQNFSQDQIYHLSFDGKLMFSFDKVSGKVSWQHQARLIEVNCKNIVSAQLYTEQDVFIVVSVPNQTDKRLQGFALDGSLLFEKDPPQGYDFMYLSISRNQPSVVCDGGKSNSDAYGRSTWHFAIDTKTGDMTKENLAY